MNWQSPQYFSHEVGTTTGDTILAVRRKKSKKTKDAVLLGQLLVAFAIIVFAFALSLSGANTATLKLFIGPQQRVFTGEVTPGMTVLDALNTSAVAGSIPFAFAIKEQKTEILQFGGISTANTYDRLSFYLNERQLDPQKIHETLVEPDDEIIVRYAMPLR